MSHVPGLCGFPRLHSKIPPAQKRKAMCICYVTVFCRLEIQAQLHRTRLQVVGPESAGTGVPSEAGLRKEPLGRSLGLLGEVIPGCRTEVPVCLSDSLTSWRLLVVLSQVTCSIVLLTARRLTCSKIAKESHSCLYACSHTHDCMTGAMSCYFYHNLLV